MSAKPCRKCGGTERKYRSDRIGPCVKCSESYTNTLEYYYKNRDNNMMNYKWRLNKLYMMAKSRSSKKGRDINISTDYLIELWDLSGGRCAISGRPFELKYSDDGGPHPDGPSLDRVDSSKGYIIGNVRLVTYHVNTALSSFGEDKLIELMESITRYRKEVK